MFGLSSQLLTVCSPLFPPTSDPFCCWKRGWRRWSSVRVSMELASEREFPHLPPVHRALMLNIIHTFNDAIGSALLPSAVPPDLLRFQNTDGSAHGSIDIRPASEPSLIDFVLQSWLHFKTPGGGEINIATLFAFLNSSTDAPHFLFELIDGGPTSFVLLVDLLPRKDLVLNPDYLDEFYNQTDLDGPRRDLEKLPQALPYRSSSIFIRSILSPVAVAISIDCGKEGEVITVEDILAGKISRAVKMIVGIWLEKCARGSRRVVVEVEKDLLEKRDLLIKRKAVEIDLAANLPRMFGSEVAERVVGEIQKSFRV